jgi:hypothetical protein
MSRDIKYIGMDVHKEATVIAVLNANGNLVMESIVETKAGSLLSLFTVCGANCMSLGKKAPGQPGSTICSSPRCRCGSAIRDAMPY